MGDSIIETLAEDFLQCSGNIFGEVAEDELWHSINEISKNSSISKSTLRGMLNDTTIACIRRGFHVGFKRAVNLILERKAAD